MQDQQTVKRLQVGSSFKGLEIWRTEMLEKIQKSLIELVLESIREDRRGTTSVPTTIVNGVINSFVAVEDPKQRIPGDPSNHLTVS
jgi:hypothetical protein